MRVHPGELCREATQIYAGGASFKQLGKLQPGIWVYHVEETPQAKCYSVLDGLFLATLQL